MKKREEIKELSDFLFGFSVAVKMGGDFNGAEKLQRASEWLHCLSLNVCSHGVVGCTGGDNCTSSHK